MRTIAGGEPTSIVRGGMLDNVLKQAVDENGLLKELSVNSGEGLSVPELASYPAVPRYGRISVTTVEDLVGRGGTITPNPLEGNPYHPLILGITPQDLVDIMEEMANPSKMP